MEAYSGQIQLGAFLKECLNNLDEVEGICPVCRKPCKREGMKIVYCVKYEPKED